MVAWIVAENSSSNVHVWSVSPAACAGVISCAEWMRQKLKCATNIFIQLTKRT